jgi:hypothetical protein
MEVPTMPTTKTTRPAKRTVARALMGITAAVGLATAVAAPTADAGNVPT